MLKKENLKSYIDELIKEVEEELDESNVTGNVDGYQTPFAFSGKTKQDKAKADSNIEVTGYTKVKDIDESINEEKVYIDFLNKKKGFKQDRIKFNSYEDAVKWARKNFDKFDTDMIKYESVNEALKHLIHVETPTQIVSKPVAAQILALAKKGVRSSEIGLNMGFMGNQKLAIDAFQKVKNKIYFELDKRNESVNEGKVKRPINRWLELKNDESMHANKKLAVGLKELKYQLSEVEKFFRWYNQIKTMNELSSDVFWKRTHGHIYKIKERLINIAKTIQEIEK
jgi:hypothetical protein